MKILSSSIMNEDLEETPRFIDKMMKSVNKIENYCQLVFTSTL